MKSSTLLLATFLLIGLFEHELEKCTAEKILFLSFVISKSHQAVFDPLIYELANRNHSITILSGLKLPKPHQNIREIVGPSFTDPSLIKHLNMFEKRVNNEPFNPLVIGKVICEDLCRKYYKMSELQALRNETFDLILINAVANECVYGLVHDLQVPFVILSPMTTMQWNSDATGTPSPFSFVPNIFLGATHSMKFLERIAYLLGQVMMGIDYNYFYLPKMENVYREFFGEQTPSIREIRKNVSLILSNSHPTLNFPRPLMQDIVEVGGMACTPAKSLGKDLDDFLTGAGKEGAIYFSMGSVIKSKITPESFKKIFINVFSKLKQKVLWKWDGEEMSGLSKNVKLEKWLPQQDVLGHPNVKMFITHGGLGSTVEAAYHGVPLVGIPLFSDQDTNMKNSVSLGYAVSLEYRDLTEESVLKAIKKILNEPKYEKRAKELSSLYRDRPQSPLETAVYWIEYVIRHKGARHLRSPARDLNWFQYHSFDTVAFIIGVLLLLICTLVLSCRLTLRKCSGLWKNADNNKKKH